MLRLLVLGFLAALSGVGAAMAQDVASDDGGFLRGAYIHLGGSLTREADGGTMSVDGTPVPTAKYQTSNMYAASFEAGVLLRGGFGVSVSGTAPETTSNIGAGALAGLGNLGDETDGFYALTAHYHAAITDRIVPYFGGGVGYMYVFGTKDGVVSHFAVKSAAGLVAQAGLDVRVTDNLGVFFDAKRYFLSTTASGTLGPSKVTAQAVVDPWIISAGASLSF